MNKLLKYVEAHALNRHRMKPESSFCLPVSIECSHELIDRPELGRQEEYLISLQFGHRAFCDIGGDREYAREAFFRYLKNEFYEGIRSLANELDMAIYDIDIDALRSILGRIREEIGD